jgi:hypothetical protein
MPAYSMPRLIGTPITPREYLRIRVKKGEDYYPSIAQVIHPEDTIRHDDGYDSLARIIDELLGWDKETAIRWAGACEVTIPRRNMLNWERLPFPQAHH